VELAVVLPLFVLLVFGTIEFGRMVMVQQLITNAAREGARSAILDGATTADVTSAVTSYLTASAVSGTSVVVSPDPPSSAPYGSSVTVRVSVPFDAVSWLPSPMYLAGKTLQAQCVMRRETVQ
jgi:Flp pilus assembly protein TadG